MALLKPIEIRNTGLVAEYWRLTHCQIDHEAGIAEFRLHGYPSREARLAGKAPLPAIIFRLTPEALGAQLKASIDKWVPAVRAAGVKPE